MGRNGTSLSISDGELGDQFRELKKASDAPTNDEFIRALIDESEQIEVRLEDLDTVELEKTKEAKETRAMAVGVLEAMQRTGIKEDVIDLVEELRKRELVEMNKKIVQYLLQKAKTSSMVSLESISEWRITIVWTIDSYTWSCPCNTSSSSASR